MKCQSLCDILKDNYELNPAVSPTFYNQLYHIMYDTLLKFTYYLSDLTFQGTVPNTCWYPINASSTEQPCPYGVYNSTDEKGIYK